VSQAPAVRRRRASRGSGEQLRTEIVTAAKALLAETASSEAVSIRAVAQRVGVTAPSIYLHFADKDALLDAVVSDVFEDLDLAIQKEVADLESTEPLAVLRAQGLGYIKFALAHPEHYRVGTMEPCPVPPNVDEVIQSGAFTHIITSVGECMSAGIFADGDPLPIALDLWAMAHGIASLMIAKSYLPWGDPVEFAERALCACLLGHVVVSELGEPTPEKIAGWIETQHRGKAPRKAPVKKN
jgi:AcrR family transcriptional regulator